MRPKVSVIMSVRNGEEFVSQAIKSVLEQSMEDFEFLVADDMSTDGTAATLCRAAAQDKRIRLVVNYENMGLTKSLNKLIGMSAGEYIARIDADDRARGDRLQRQCDMFVDDFVMCASCYRAVDESGSPVYSHCPDCDPAVMEWSLVFRNNIRHSTVMWRSEAGLLYDERYKYAQDYDMWCRMSRVGKIAVVTEPLADIRIHDSAITSEKRDEQDDAAAAITAEQFKHHTGREIAKGEARNLRLIHHLKDKIQFDQYFDMSDSEIKCALSMYIELLEKFKGPEKIAEEVEKDMRSIMDTEKGNSVAGETSEILRRFGKK